MNARIGLLALSALLLLPTLLSGCRRASSTETPDSAIPHVVAADSVAAGRYLVVIGMCNDCHTPGYMEAGGAMPESEWLTGSLIGFRGPWGTTYPSNLRLVAQALSEDAFVEVLRTRKSLPPMPWVNVNRLTEGDARAIHRYIRSLGPRGGRCRPSSRPTRSPPRHISTSCRSTWNASPRSPPTLQAPPPARQRLLPPRCNPPRSPCHAISWYSLRPARRSGGHRARFGERYAHPTASGDRLEPVGWRLSAEPGVTPHIVPVGSDWSAVGGSLSGSADAIAIAADGTIYVGGTFLEAGGVPAQYVAMWDGAAWSSLGGANDWVFTLTLGTNGVVYAGGRFTQVGGVAATRIAYFDPNSQTWNPIGAGFNNPVEAIVEGPDGCLYAAGGFRIVGDNSGQNIARTCVGNVWEYVGGGTDNTVYDIAFDGEVLYAVGVFNTAGGVTVNRVAKWNGTNWSSVGGGVTQVGAARRSTPSPSSPAAIFSSAATSTRSAASP